jgi:hypothetical protein
LRLAIGAFFLPVNFSNLSSNLSSNFPSGFPFDSPSNFAFLQPPERPRFRRARAFHPAHVTIVSRDLEKTRPQSVRIFRRGILGLTGRGGARRQKRVTKEACALGARDIFRVSEQGCCPCGAEELGLPPCSTLSRPARRHPRRHRLPLRRLLLPTVRKDLWSIRLQMQECIACLPKRKYERDLTS